MATVYKGYHAELDRYVAIKVLPPHPGRDPHFVERFRLEARTIARLQHPHVLSLYDYGSEDDIFYLAMAFVEGGALSRLIHPGGLPLMQVEILLREVASALDYAHRQGVIHRDIKPANILLDKEGHTFLADFGIAKMMGSSSTLTGTGSVVGTPSYMAPEQSQGDKLDPRADIYSLGVVAFELLSGRLPYITANPLQMIMKHINEPIPSITQVRADLPEEIESVIQRVLAKTPDQRYQTVNEFFEDFSKVVHSRDPESEQYLQARTAADSSPTAPTSLSPQPTIALAQNDIITPNEVRSYTFLFSNIEGGTHLWERYPHQMSAALAHHDIVMAQVIDMHLGKIFKTFEDSVYAAFNSADDALQAALSIQRLIYQASIRPEDPLLLLPVRMGLYSGEVEERDGEYFGLTINRASRVVNAAHGGQILLTEATRSLLPPETELRDLGIHRLPDINEPERIYQAISSEFPLNAKPIRTLTPRPTNIPAQLTSFVGRARELSEIANLLRQPNVRLLTLLGADGIGKTRLSIQVGSTLLDEYEDGIFFIPLAPLNRIDAAVKYVAQALNVVEETSTPLIESLKAYLRARQVLLIFDNFEHLLDDAPLLNDLLTAAARLKILVTSRESLFIYGEHTYTVPPLDLPEVGEDLGQMLRSSAVSLFVERVQAMQSDFALALNNAADVIRICRQLDGLPLALELAAARVRDLTLPEIAEQISQRLALLSKGPRDLPKRQQTMRGAIDWSYHLLSDEEQRAFARLAVFEGSFYGNSARTITGIPDPQTLRNKSLLQEATDEVYSMLAVLREFALERLDEFGEAGVMRDQHGLYYCAWLETAENSLNGRDQIEWYARLKVEQYNLRAALEWFLHQQQIENAGRMVRILWRYWATQSQFSEGAHWFEQVLEHADQLSPYVHAGATQGAGRLALLRHEYTRATDYQMISLRLYRSIGDQAGQAAVLMSLGETEYVQGHLDEAEQYFNDSLSIFRAISNEAGIGRCLNNIGNIAKQRGDFANAEPILYESLALAHEHGSTEAVAVALYDLAGVLRAQEKYDQALTYYQESMALYRELDFAVGVAVMLNNLGFVLQSQGNILAAMEHFLEALKLLRYLDEPIAIFETLLGMAGVFLKLDKHIACVQTLGAANALLTSIHGEDQIDYVDQVEYKRLYAAAQVDQPEWQGAWSAGQLATLEEAIQDVFKEAQPRLSITSDTST